MLGYQVDPIRRIGRQALRGGDVGGLHRENQIGIADESRRERAGAVLREIEAS
ncbi:MAG TPA: hypothetical protein VL503_08630 [Candidatus Omnitrophota bacterium]|nr:hypothetical protein [Candidatus Omnitrophota bacterium]